MKKIKRIAIVPTAMALAIVMLIIKFVLGIITTIIIQVPAVQDAMNTASSLGVIPNVLQLGVGMQLITLVILGPIVSAVVTFVAAAVLIWLYNLVAKKWAITLDLA